MSTSKGARARQEEVGVFPQLDLLWALGSLSALHRRVFSADLLQREFPGEGNVAKLIQAASSLGFKVKQIHPKAGKLAGLPLPLLVAVKGGASEGEGGSHTHRLALITAITSDQAVLFAAGTNTP